MKNYFRRVTLGERVGTVCAVDEKETGTFKIGVAVKSKRDQLVKKLGNKIAIGRAIKKPLTVINSSSLTTLVKDMGEIGMKELSRVHTERDTK